MTFRTSGRNRSPCPNFEIGCGYYKGLAPCRVSLVRFPLPASSATDPVIHLDLKDIRRTIAEDCASLRGEIEIAVGIASCPALRPHEEDGRAWAILPPQHGVADQRAEGEVRVAERKRGRWTCAIRICRVCRAAHSGRRRTGNRADVPSINRSLEGARRHELAKP